MTQLGFLLPLLAAGAIAACTVQIVPPIVTPVTPDTETRIRSSAKPEPAPSGKPSSSPDAPTFTLSDAYVKSYECAPVVKPGAAIALKVHYGLADPSWSFDKLVVEVDEAAKVIHVKPTMKRRVAQPGESGVSAPAVIVETVASTEFTVKTSGQYTFVSPRYLSGDPKTTLMVAESEARPVLTVVAQGGRCALDDCSQTTKVMSNGSYTTFSGEVAEGKGTLPAESVEVLAREIARADFAAIKQVHFTGTCPTVVDGQEQIYTFYTATGVEELSSCGVQIDYASPLFQAVESIRKAIEGAK